MGANGWRDAVAHKILEVQGDPPGPGRRALRHGWSPEGVDGVERDHAETAGFKDEDELSRLVEQLNAGVYIVAADGVLAYVNPLFARNLGYEPDEVIGRPILGFIAEFEARGGDRTLRVADGRRGGRAPIQLDASAQGRLAGRRAGRQCCREFPRPKGGVRGAHRNRRAHAVGGPDPRGRRQVPQRRRTERRRRRDLARRTRRSPIATPASRT